MKNARGGKCMFKKQYLTFVLMSLLLGYGSVLLAEADHGKGPEMVGVTTWEGEEPIKDQTSKGRQKGNHRPTYNPIKRNVDPVIVAIDERLFNENDHWAIQTAKNLMGMIEALRTSKDVQTFSYDNVIAKRVLRGNSRADGWRLSCPGNDQR